MGFVGMVSLADPDALLPSLVESAIGSVGSVVTPGRNNASIVVAYVVSPCSVDDKTLFSAFLGDSALGAVGIVFFGVATSSSFDLEEK